MTYPKVNIEWEPSPDGVALTLGYRPERLYKAFLPMSSVQELRDDMEEAFMLARGYYKIEAPVDFIEPKDLIEILGHYYEVENLLKQSKFRYEMNSEDRKNVLGGTDEDEVWVIQFALGSYTSIQTELSLPGDEQVTIWRPIQ